jgi:hypothetical protein
MRVIQSILNLYTNFLMATDHAKQGAIGILAGISANIILSLLLIPHIGIAGAAVGALVNVIISIFIARRYLARNIPISIERKSIGHIFLATIVMTISLLVLGMLPLNQSLLQTIMMVIIGAAIYFAVLQAQSTDSRRCVQNVQNYMDTEIRRSPTAIQCKTEYGVCIPVKPVKHRKLSKQNGNIRLHLVFHGSTGN